jgi:DNA-binding beta-propeller fold protein YncE
MVPGEIYLRGRHPRRRVQARLIGVVAAACVIVAVVAGWIMTRPPSVRIVAIPGDALISFGGLPKDVGTFSAPNLEPGSYRLRVTRTGFEPFESEVRLSRGMALRREVRLVPYVFPFAVLPSPATAAYVLAPSGGKSVRGTGALSTRLPAGPFDLTLRQPGYNTLKQRSFLDSPTQTRLWLDPQGQLLHCLMVLRCGRNPKGLALSPDGKQVWVTLLGTDPGVEVYESATGRKLGQISLGKSGAVDIVLSADGKRAWAAQMQTSTIFSIDTAKKRVVHKSPTGGTWTQKVELSADGKTLMASNWTSNDVSLIDLATGFVSGVKTVAGPQDLWASPDGKYLYVAGLTRGELEKIDRVTGQARIIFSSGGALRSFAADARRRLLYVSDMAKDVIWVTDLATDKTRRFASTDHKPVTIRLTPDGRVLFVSDRGANNPGGYFLRGPEWGTVLAFDTNTGKPLDAIVGGNQCTSLDVSSDGKTLAFTDYLDGDVRIYAIPSYSTLAAGSGGRFPSHLRDLKKR